MKPNEAVVRVTNRNSFTNLREFDVRWTLTCDGQVAQMGELPLLDAPPGGSVEMKVPVQPAPHQPSDHTPGRQRNRQLNHRLSLDQLAERTFAAACRFVVVA